MVKYSCSNVLVFWKWHKGANKRAGKVGCFNHHFSSFIPGPLHFRGKLVGHCPEDGSDISFHCSRNQACSLVLSVSWHTSPWQGCWYFGLVFFVFLSSRVHFPKFVCFGFVGFGCVCMWVLSFIRCSFFWVHWACQSIADLQLLSEWKFSPKRFLSTTYNKGFLWTLSFSVDLNLWNNLG